MITLPSNARLIEVVRKGLGDPGDADDSARVKTLTLADSLLAVIERSCECEVDWMLEEIEQIEAVASTLVESGDDVDGRVAKALTRLQDSKPESLTLHALRARYRQASALLAECAEVALTAGGEVRERVEVALSTRMNHEQEIRGSLTFVSRG